MNLFVAAASEFWWVAPSAAGAGLLGIAGMRWRWRSSGRRLGYEAARWDLRRAQEEAATRRVQLRVARTEYARLAAERARDGVSDAAGARQRLRDAERAAKAATAAVRARRAQKDAAAVAMAGVRGPEHLPLARLESDHAAITARWMAYETDPDTLLAYPAMADVRHPPTARFLEAVGVAQQCRPRAGQRLTPAEFSAYRDAVSQLRSAFDAAERSARGHAAPGEAGRAPGAWQDAAQSMLQRSGEVLDRAAAAASAALAAWNERQRRDPDEPRR